METKVFIGPEKRLLTFIYAVEAIAEGGAVDAKKATLYALMLTPEDGDVEATEAALKANASAVLASRAARRLLRLRRQL